MPYPKICPQCGKGFTGNRKGVIYCSISCANSNTASYALENPKEFFLKHVLIPTDQERDCWLWQGTKDAYGYGRLPTQKQKNARAHRVAFALFYGQIPKGMHILHSCDNPPCVSPHHLRTGNPSDNARDRVEHGRQSRGDAHPYSVLTEEKVKNILHAFHVSHIKQRTLAIEYNVHPVTIHDVVHRKTWAHVLPDLFPSPHIDGRSVIPHEVVLRVRKLRDAGATYDLIAQQFKLSIGQVHRIINHLAYTYVG